MTLNNKEYDVLNKFVNAYLDSTCSLENQWLNDLFWDLSWILERFAVYGKTDYAREVAFRKNITKLTCPEPK